MLNVEAVVDKLRVPVCLPRPYEGTIPVMVRSPKVGPGKAVGAVRPTAAIYNKIHEAALVLGYHH